MKPTKEQKNKILQEYGKEGLAAAEALWSLPTKNTEGEELDFSDYWKVFE